MYTYYVYIYIYIYIYIYVYIIHTYRTYLKSFSQEVKELVVRLARRVNLPARASLNQ